MTSTETPLRTDEAAALTLMRSLRAFAEDAAAPDALELVSVSIDASASAASLPEKIECRIDRKTRTLIFAAATAEMQGAVGMTATVIYRRLVAED